MRFFKLVTFLAATIVGGCLMTVFGFMQRDGEPIYPHGLWKGPVVIVLGVILIVITFRNRN